MKSKHLILAATAVLAATLVACGGAEEKAAPTAATTKAAAPAATTAAATAAASTPTATPTAVAATSIGALTAGEEGENKYFFEPNKLTLKAGEVTVKLTNKAGNQRPHTLAVKDASGKEIFRSDRVQPGQAADVKFTVADAGTYQILCVLQGHADKGQTGTLTVVKG